MIGVNVATRTYGSRQSRQHTPSVDAHGGRQNHICIYEATGTYRQRSHTGEKAEAAIDPANLSTRVVGVSAWRWRIDAGVKACVVKPGSDHIQKYST